MRCVQYTTFNKVTLVEETSGYLVEELSLQRFTDNFVG